MEIRTKLLLHGLVKKLSRLNLDRNMMRLKGKLLNTIYKKIKEKTPVDTGLLKSKTKKIGKNNKTSTIKNVSTKDMYYNIIVHEGLGVGKSGSPRRFFDEGIEGGFEDVHQFVGLVEEYIDTRLNTLNF